jgi:hypothetical protein
MSTESNDSYSESKIEFFVSKLKLTLFTSIVIIDIVFVKKF